MKVNCEMVSITWCPASATVPSQPTMMMLRLNEAVSMPICSPTGQPSALSRLNHAHDHRHRSSPAR